MRQVALLGGVGFVAEAGDPPAEPDPEVTARAARIQTERDAEEWAEGKHVQQDVDAADSVVQQLIADVQTTKAAIKAASSGLLTLTKAQHLTIARGLLYLLKGDKAA